MINAIGLVDQKLSTSGAGGLSQALGSFAQGTESVPGASFGELLSAAASRTVGALQEAETVSMKALQGDADTRAVVDAVMSAEQALQAAVAIRDKIVSAYLDISRMAI